MRVLEVFIVADLNMIQKRIDQLEKLQEEVRVSKEMLKGELENDLSYLESVEEVKASSQKRKQKKDEILGSGPNQEVLKNIKDNQEEIGTLKEILSTELMQVYQENKTDQIADRKFVISVRLLPKKSTYDKRNSFGQYSQ
jgi:hypothetical protein